MGSFVTWPLVFVLIRRDHQLTNQIEKNDIKSEIELVNLDILKVLLQNADISCRQYVLFDLHKDNPQLLSFLDFARR